MNKRSATKTFDGLHSQNNLLSFSQRSSLFLVFLLFPVFTSFIRKLLSFTVQKIYGFYCQFWAPLLFLSPFFPLFLFYRESIPFHLTLFSLVAAIDSLYEKEKGDSKSCLLRLIGCSFGGQTAGMCVARKMNKFKIKNLTPLWLDSTNRLLLTL